VSVSPAPGVRLLFSSITPGKWTLAPGNVGNGLDCSDDRTILTLRFRALKDGDSTTIQTNEETCIFPHKESPALLPSPASATLSFGEGTVHIPLIMNTDKWETSIGLVEIGSTSDDIALMAQDNNGTTVASTSLSLAPGQLLVRSVADLFGNISSVASVRITGNGAVHAWTEYRDRENGAAAACPASIETDTQLLVPHVDEGNYWNTFTGIVNCGVNQSSLTFTAAGNEVTVNEHTPPEGGYHDRFIHLMDETLLQGGWGMFDGNTTPLAGAEIFYRVDNLHQAAALCLSDKTARTFYFPHIDITGFWWTGISLINPGNEAATVRLTAFDTDGYAIPDTGTSTGTTTFSLPGQTRRVDLVENFFDKPLDPKAAWIRVESDQPLTGLEIFGSRAGFQEDLSAGLEAVSEPSLSTTFPWATDGENEQWSGLALLNPDDRNPADNITITLYKNDGTIGGLAALHLNPLEKHVVLIRNLFGGTVPADGAYLTVQSDMPLVGFMLTGDDSHQWLMGLNGM
ncbi:MAG: hypothetical protein GXO70_11850, partial [Acidobacteria bacterium]|nr:hypothetical protein [Acidobacteriota bacterium]